MQPLHILHPRKITDTRYCCEYIAYLLLLFFNLNPRGAIMGLEKISPHCCLIYFQSSNKTIYYCLNYLIRLISVFPPFVPCVASPHSPVQVATLERSKHRKLVAKRRNDVIGVIVVTTIKLKVTFTSRFNWNFGNENTLFILVQSIWESWRSFLCLCLLWALRYTKLLLDNPYRNSSLSGSWIFV